MKTPYRIILIVFLAFIIWIFFWALYTPKEDISTRIQRTLKEQEKQADLTFKEVTFEEVVAGIKYWELRSNNATVNKSTGIATLKKANGTFFKKGKPVLRFKSPAALWDMANKEILLDKPLGYDINLERKINSLITSLKRSKLSIFNLPKLYEKGQGYWFQANNLSWKLDNQKLVCQGGIVLNKGDVTGYAKRLEGDVGLERILLQGNPKIVIQPANSAPITVEAKEFEVVSEEDVILARGNPRIYWQTARIEAKTLKYLQREDNLELIDNVKIIYDDITARGSSASYLTKLDQIIIKGNAQASQGENKLSGEQVMVSLKDKKISVIGKGRVVITEEDLPAGRQE